MTDKLYYKSKNNFVFKFNRTLIYSVLISFILITPLIYSKNLFAGVITAKQIWFYGAIALLMLAFSIDLLFYRKNDSLSFNVIDFALLTFYTYFFIRSVFTHYTPLLYNTRFLNYSLLTLFYIIVKYVIHNSVSTKEPNYLISFDIIEKKEVTTSTEILVTVLMLMGLIQAAWGFLQLYGILPSFHSMFKITGTFFNPAPYSLYLGVIFPLALGRLLLIKGFKKEGINNERPKNSEFLLKTRFFSFFLNFNSLIPSFLISKLSYYISLLTVIAILLLLPATMNRASWLGLSAGSLLILNYRYNLLNKAHKFLRTKPRKLAAIFCTLIIVITISIGLYRIKPNSSFGRLFIWEVTTSAVKQTQIFGAGIGRFEADYNNWQANYFKAHPNLMTGPKGMTAGNTLYCFNEYLEIASESGIIGLLLFLVLIGITLFTIFRKIITDTTHIKTELISLLGAFVSILVCAMISFPFYSLPTLIVFFLLLAILSSRITEIPKSFWLLKLLKFRGISKTVLLFVFLPASVLLLLMTRQQYKVWNTWHEAVILYQTKSFREACKLYSEIYVPLQCNGSYLQFYGKALYLNGEYAKSITMLEQARKFSSNEILYCNLGDSYKAGKMYDRAEEAYKYASFVIPNKLYPLYLLAILYDDSGQKEMAVKIAGEILNKKIKVESEATEEIKSRMKMIIRNKD